MLPPRPLAIAAGRYHTLLLRQGEAGGGHGASVWEEGGAARVYACGRNVCGQLGLPLATAATATPTVVSQLETLLKPRLWLGPGLRGAGGSREGEGRMGGEEASGVVKGDSVCAVACGAMHSVALSARARNFVGKQRLWTAWCGGCGGGGRERRVVSDLELPASVCRD